MFFSSASVNRGRKSGITRGWGITPMEGKINSYNIPPLGRPEDKAPLSLHRHRLKIVKKVKDVAVHDLKAHGETGVISELVCKLAIRRG